MAFTLVNNVAGVNFTGAIDTTGADLLVAWSSYDSGATISDSKGNTWTALTARSHNGSDSFGRLYYVENPTVGTGHTFSISLFYVSIFVQAWSGSATVAYDQEVGATSSSATSIQPGSLTPSENDCLIVCGVANGSTGNSFSINSGFTISNTINPLSGSYYGGSMAYKVQTGAAAENPTYSWTNSITAAVTQVSFKGIPSTVVNNNLTLLGIN